MDKATEAVGRRRQRLARPRCGASTGAWRPGPAKDVCAGRPASQSRERPAARASRTPWACRPTSSTRRRCGARTARAPRGTQPRLALDAAADTVRWRRRRLARPCCDAPTSTGSSEGPACCPGRQGRERPAARAGRPTRTSRPIPPTRGRGGARSARTPHGAQVRRRRPRSARRQRRPPTQDRADEQEGRHAQAGRGPPWRSGPGTGLPVRLGARDRPAGRGSGTAAWRRRSTAATVLQAARRVLWQASPGKCQAAAAHGWDRAKATPSAQHRARPQSPARAARRHCTRPGRPDRRPRRPRSQVERAAPRRARSDPCSGSQAARQPPQQGRKKRACTQPVGWPWPLRPSGAKQGRTAGDRSARPGTTRRTTG